MAYHADVYGARPKVRNPVGVFVLTLVTLGLYGLYWYYRANEELREFGTVYQDPGLANSKPSNSLLALIPGALVHIPAIVSLLGFAGRIRSAQAIAQVKQTPVIVMPVLILLYYATYALGLLVALEAIVEDPADDTWAAVGGIQVGVAALSTALLQTILNGIWKRYPRADESIPSAQFAQPLSPVAAAAAAAAARQPAEAEHRPADVPAATVVQPTPEPAAPEPAAAAGPPANWYPDPWGQARLRYWDGEQWTGHISQ